MRKAQTEVAVYKGDEFLFTGTIQECAEHFDVRQETIRYYLTPAYAKKLAKRKRSRKAIQVIRIDDEDDEDQDDGEDQDE